MPELKAMNGERSSRSVGEETSASRFSCYIHEYETEHIVFASSYAYASSLQIFAYLIEYLDRNRLSASNSQGRGKAAVLFLKRLRIGDGRHQSGALPVAA